MKKNNYNETEGIMNTIIGKDTHVNGTVNVKGSLRVDGSLTGKIICTECVTIGASGQVDAEIEAASAIIAGKLKGNVMTNETIELQAKCEMEGDLKTKSLVIEQGAIFCGACNMKETKSDLGFLPPENEPEMEMAESTESD